MAHSGQKNVELQDRRRKVWYMRLRGMSLKEIAAAIRAEAGGTYSIATAGKDIEAVRQEWRAEQSASVDEWVNEQLAELELLREQAMAEWERSKLQTKSLKEESSAKDGEKTTITIEERLGDPRYLSVVQDCIEKRAKLLGLYKPEKRELLGPNGKPLVSLESLRAIQAAIAGDETES